MDVETRTLQRSDAAPARLLLSHLRAGRLSRARVELAAYLGHEPALAVAEPARLEVPEWASGWSPVRRALRWGGMDQVALVRVACDLGERSLRHAGEHREVCEAAYAAARAWADCPCEEHRAEARAAAWAARAAAAWAAEAAAAAAAAAEAWAEAEAWAAAAWAAAEAWAAWAVGADEEQWQAEHLAALLCDLDWPCEVTRGR